MPQVRSSRRVPPLKESDIDHEINLVDHSGSTQGTRPVSPTPEDGDTTTDPPVLTSSESYSLLRQGAAPISRIEDDPPDEGQDDRSSHEVGQRDSIVERPRTPTVQPATPAAEVREPSESGQPQYTNGNRVSKVPLVRRHPRPKSPEKTIDILYENERGGFLCGIPLFSGAALGNLDPAPWTNELHKPSPTDVKTAQVPEPTWEWSWPSWRVNRDDTIDSDKDGWEYSFMFSKKFSWHGPKWYNSFVRRRAWIRQRMKKNAGYEANDIHLLNTDYFTVGSTSAKGHSRQGSSVAAGGSNRTSVLVPNDEDLEQNIEIQNIDVLMNLVRRYRIDREKLDAVHNYIEHSTDNLLPLQEHMHEIMSAFVFQTSRQLLLTMLMEVYDGYTYQKDRSKTASTDHVAEPPTIQLQSLEGSDAESNGARHPTIPKEPETEEDRKKLEEKVKNLAAAIKHADEEVRRLKYWSDVKGMAEGAGSRGAVADDNGWEEGWDGIDRSGGLGPNREELP